MPANGNKVQKPSAHKHPCTECKGDAFVAFGFWKDGKEKKPLVKRGERLCLACASKRGVKFWRP